MIPLVFIAFSYVKDENDFSKVLNFIMFFITLAVLCYPYQYLFGRVSWFAEPHERAGVERFSTFLGSLTVNGAAFPLAMFILIHSTLKQYIKFILFSILLVGAFFSLQKSAIVGVILVLLYMSISFIKKLDSKKIKRLLIAVPLLILAVFLVDKGLSNIPEWVNLKLYTFSQLGLIKDVNRAKYVTDVSIGQSIFDRVFGYLVLQALGWLKESQGFLGYILGGSYGMLGPALVPVDKSIYITSHNGYVDFILVGGIFHLLAFLGILLRSMQLFWRSYKNSRSIKVEYQNIYLCGFTLFMFLSILTMFGGAVTFQPIIGGLFWILVAFAWKLENRYSLRQSQESD